MEQRHNEFYEINQVTATYNRQDNVTLPLVIWIIRKTVQKRVTLCLLL